ncbi:MAG TPA: L-aspartate oxidase [Acidimicrobiia bacterium]
MYDLLVLGSGVAGLTTALSAARQGMSVLVLTKTELANTATRYAQGGVAAAFAPPDSPDLHLADTMIAGAGLCDPDAVSVLVREGPARVRDLSKLGATFDAGDTEDSWHLAREGGHSLARVVHAGGDATGAEVERALVAALARNDVDVREGWCALELIVDHDHCSGVVALDPKGLIVNVLATDTVLATGGAGQCFAVTTNPLVSTGDGIALALRAGVACADLEFMQFHPTALHVDAMPRPLLSEALRGEGAVLRDGDGVAFMQGVHPLADLAPRDVVSRQIAHVLAEHGVDHVWLDATPIADFGRRFPTISRACANAGLDPEIDWLPVAPAAHFLCGGAVTDLDGATTLPQLWSCGETACSGVHGANRLASNSLLDGLVFGRRVVNAIVAGKAEPEPTGAMRGVLGAACAPPESSDLELMSMRASIDAAGIRGAVQRVMSTDAGVVRDAAGLDLAAKTLADLALLAPELPPREVASYEALNVLRVARAIVTLAQARHESRGAHTRADFPEPDDAMLGRFVYTGSSTSTSALAPFSELEPGRTR